MRAYYSAPSRRRPQVGYIAALSPRSELRGGELMALRRGRSTAGSSSSAGLALGPVKSSVPSPDYPAPAMSRLFVVGPEGPLARLYF